MAWMKGYLIALVAQLVKNPACNAGDPGSIPGSGRSPREGIDYPTPVLRPGEVHGLYSPWGCKESDMAE